MGWEYGAGGTRYWIDPKTGKVGTPPAKRAKDPAPEPTNPDKGHTKHKVLPGASTGSGKKGVKSREKARASAQAEMLARQQKAAAAAKKIQAQADARQARIEAKQARILEATGKRGDRINNRMQRELKSIQAAKAAAASRLELVNEQIKQAQARGDSQALSFLLRQQQAAISALGGAQGRERDLKTGTIRAMANEDLRFRTAKNGEPLSPAELRAARQERHDNKQELLEKSVLPAVSAARYSKLKAGDVGRGAELRAALREATALQAAHPEVMDDALFAWLGAEIDAHEKARGAMDVELQEALAADVRILETAKPGSPRYKAALRRGRKTMLELKGDDYQREYRLLYGPRVLTDINGNFVNSKGEKIDPETAQERGLLWQYAISSDLVYQKYEDHYWDSLYSAPGWLGEMIGRVKGSLARIQGMAIREEAEKTRKWIVDPITGKRVRQTVEQRITEMFNANDAERQAALDAGLLEYRDFERERAHYLDNPLLRPLYDILEERGIKNNLELTGSFGTELREDIIPAAQRVAFEEWKASDQYQVPGVAEGIYDYERYRRTENGTEFLLDDGTWVAMGDPLPDNYRGTDREPIWDLRARPDQNVIDKIGDVFAGGFSPFGRSLYDAEEQATERYERKTNQSIEDLMRLQMGVADPGALSDLLRQNAVGELVGGLDAIPGAAALALHVIVGKDVGFSAFSPGNKGRVTEAQARIDKSGLYDIAEDGTRTKVYVGEKDGIYEYKNYRRTAVGESFTYPDGTVVFKGDPIPAGREAPLWDHAPDPSIPVWERFASGDPMIGASPLGAIKEGRWNDTKNEIIGETWQQVPGQYLELESNPAYKDYEVVLVKGNKPGAAIDEGGRGTGNLFADAMDFLGFSPQSVVAKGPNGETFISTIIWTPGGPVEFMSHNSDEVQARIRQSQKDFFDAVDTGDFGIVARTLGTNELIQFGNTAGAINFAWYLLADPTNFIPGITIAKRGLAGIRAMSEATNVPSGLRRMAFYAGKFGEGARSDVKLQEQWVGVLDDLKKLKPGATEPEVYAALRRSIANLDPGSRNPGRDWLKELNKQFGLDKLGIDQQQMLRWAEHNATAMLRAKGWIVRDETTLGLERLAKMRKLVEAHKMEQRAIDSAVNQRGIRIMERFGVDGEAARLMELETRARQEQVQKQALDMVNQLFANVRKDKEGKFVQEAQLRAVRQLESRLARTTAGSKQNELLTEAVTLARERIGGNSAGGAMATGARAQGGRINLADIDPRTGRLRSQAAADAAAQRARRGAQQAHSKKGKAAAARGLDVAAAKRERDALIRRRSTRLAKIAEAKRERKLQGQQNLQRQEAAERMATMQDDWHGLPPEMAKLEAHHTGPRFLEDIPADWADSNGPRFWGNIITRGLGATTGRFIDDILKDAFTLVAGVRARHGGWHAQHASYKAYHNRVLHDFITRTGLQGREARMLYVAWLKQRGFLGPSYWKLNPEGTQIIDDFGQVVDDLGARGDDFRSWRNLVRSLANRRELERMPEFNEAYQGLVRTGAIPPGSVFEATVNFAARMAFDARFSAYDAYRWLQYMKTSPVPNSGTAARHVIEIMYVDELASWRQRLARGAPEGRTAEYAELLDEPIGLLHQELYGKVQTVVEQMSAKGEFAEAGTVATLRGFEGRSVDSALGDLEAAILKGGVNTRPVGEAVDYLAHVMVHEQFSGRDWAVTQRVIRLLRGHSARTAQGRVAKMMRDRINHELDVLGFEDNARVFQIAESDLPPVAAGFARTFRGIGGTRGRGPRAFVRQSPGGSGGTVFGNGVYSTPGFDEAADYAGLAYGDPGVVASILFKEDEVLDLRYFSEMPTLGSAPSPTIGAQLNALLGRTVFGSGPSSQALRRQQAAARQFIKFYDELVKVTSAAGVQIKPLDQVKMNEFFGYSMPPGLAPFSYVQAPGFEEYWNLALEAAGFKGMLYDITKFGTSATNGAENFHILAKDPSLFHIEQLNVVHQVPLSGPSAAEIATQQAKAIFSEFGVSEIDWLKGRLKRTQALVRNKSLSNAERRRFIVDARRIKRAIEAVEVEKGLRRYEVPRMRFHKAQTAAEKFRDRVKGVLPPKAYAYFAETVEQVKTEVLRSVHAAFHEQRVLEGVVDAELEAVLDWFPMQEWKGLNDEMGLAVQRVQGKRSSSLGLRKLQTEDEVPEIVRTVADYDPALVAAKQATLDAWTSARNLPQMSVDQYDRMRTILQKHVQRGTRTELLIAKARAMPGDFKTNFLQLRQAEVDNNAVKNVAWTLIENPGMTPDEAIRQFELSWVNDGKLRPDPQAITETDQRMLREYFEQVSGVKMDDAAGRRAVLSANGTKPPWDKQFEFRDHMVERGEWSPRAASEMDDADPGWSMAEEKAFFEARYADAPAWVTDSRLRRGPNGETGVAFVSRGNYYDTMTDVGNYNDQQRVARALGEEQTTNYDGLSFGVQAEDGTWIIKPTKDWATERRWMVMRHGDEVGTFNPDGTVHLTAAPWLMTPDELAEFRMLNVGADLGPLVVDPEEILKVRLVMGELADKYANRFIHMAGAIPPGGGAPVITTQTVHRLAYDMVQELAITQAWRGVWHHFRNREVLDVWAAFWRAVVVSNPAFIISNIIDTPTKGFWFRGTDRFARRASQEAIEEIPDVDALGIGGTAFWLDAGNRSNLDRIRPSTTYGRLDQLGGAFDLATNGLAKNILQPVERTVKRDVARSIYTGLKAELAPALRAQGHSERNIRMLVKLRTKAKILKMFPSMDNAGLVERLINKVFPFVSYNFRNKVLWTTEVIEHPWLIPVVQEMQSMLINYNTENWKARHPGEPVPEHLMHQINIPGTDMYFDIGMFTDAARGAAPVMGDYSSVGDFLNGFIRPLPAQMAFAQAAGWNLFGLFGRDRWQKVIGEDGFWNGEYEKVVVPPGTPWGDRPLDIWKDFFWPVKAGQAIQTALEDGKLNGAEAIRIIGNIVTFSEFGEPSRYSMLMNQYTAMADVSQELATEWLKSPEGQELKEMWDQNFWKPTDTKLGLGAFAAAVPTGAHVLEVRKAWLMQQPPEMREQLFSAWNERTWADNYWDTQIDNVTDPEERQRLWEMRRAWFGAFYHSRPFLWNYQGFGMSPEEVAEEQAKFLLDDKRAVFFSLYSWALAPDDAAARAEWEKQREQWLDANPDLKASLNEIKDSWDEANARNTHLIDLAVKTGIRLDAIAAAAYERGNEKLGDEFKTWRKTQGWAYERETFGYDAEEGRYRFEADNLTTRLRAAAGDRAAQKKILYGQRMQAAAEQAGDDPLKWHKIIDRHPDLREQYFENNPEKALTWERDGLYLQFWGDMDRMADKGLWDQYWDNWDGAPQWVKDLYKENNPKGYAETVGNFRYQNYMGRWVAFFDRNDPAGAARYWDTLPQWVKERYYANHKGSTLSSGRGTAYVGMLNTMFDQIDAGNWDAAERIWKNAPAWMRRRYYANNPDSTLFRGGSGSGGYSSGGYSSGGSSGPSISDAQYKIYIRAMKQWVNLQQDGKSAAADAYFRGLPKWMQDFYLARHADKQLLVEDMKVLSLLEQYLVANPAAQQAMLNNSPALRKWLMENNSEFAWRNAVQFIYSRLPDDPWLKRVYRDKYPEIFSKEAIGEEYKRATFETLADNPDLVKPWMRWYEDIFKTMQEAMKYMQVRPKSWTAEREAPPKGRSHTGRSAADVAEEIESYVERNKWGTNKRLPKLDSTA